MQEQFANLSRAEIEIVVNALRILGNDLFLNRSESALLESLQQVLREMEAEG